ncbi:biopolymer transporter ExbD [Candidatus Sumerlaeota bacterium]|nr:biopolymer transporter ExbD [Candidatus Sumerlaeota bacterium]
MKKHSKRRRHLTWSGEESINLTPLLDMIFNLIFFFILATTLRQSKALLEVRLPQSSQGALQSIEKNIIVITLTSEDRIFLGEKEATIESLEQELKTIPPNEIESLILQGDARAHHEAVVRVLDACARAGHTGVSVEVKSPQK